MSVGALLGGSGGPLSCTPAPSRCAPPVLEEVLERTELTLASLLLWAGGSLDCSFDTLLGCTGGGSFFGALSAKFWIWEDAETIDAVDELVFVRLGRGGGTSLFTSGPTVEDLGTDAARSGKAGTGETVLLRVVVSADGFAGLGGGGFLEMESERVTDVVLGVRSFPFIIGRERGGGGGVLLCSVDAAVFTELIED